MTLRPLLLLPMLAWSLSQAPEPAAADRRTADQVKTAEDSHDAGRVTPEQVKRWRMTAAQGDSQAQTELSLLYSTGNGVLRDAREAVEWFQKAAEQGDGFGQLWLATKYFEGASVARDPGKGMAWATLAAELGFYRTIDGSLGLVVPNNFSITQDLTPAEVKQMEHLTTELRLKIEAGRVGAPPSTGGERGESATGSPRCLELRNHRVCVQTATGAVTTVRGRHRQGQRKSNANRDF